VGGVIEVELDVVLVELALVELKLAIVEPKVVNVEEEDDELKAVDKDGLEVVDDDVLDDKLEGTDANKMSFNLSNLRYSGN